MEKKKNKEPRYIRGKYTPAAKEATKRYQKSAYDDIKVRVPKGRRAELQEIAAKNGISLNYMFVLAVNEFISKLSEKQDTETKPDTSNQE
jgi:predicted HicB family RNase H-like nuclease